MMDNPLDVFPGVCYKDGMTFLIQLIAALIFGGIVFGALCLLTELEVREKWQEYLIMGGAYALLSLVGEYLDFFGVISLVKLISLVWVPYKVLDFSLFRSFGVLGVVICASWLFALGVELIL